MDVMDSLDIYDNLESCYLGADIEKLQGQNQYLHDHIGSLESDVEKLCGKVTDIKSLQNNLQRNITELFKTAKAEITRKDGIIKGLRTQLNDFIYKRQKTPFPRDTITLSAETDVANPFANKARLDLQPFKKDNPLTSEWQRDRRGSRSTSRDRARAREYNNSYKQRHAYDARNASNRPRTIYPRSRSPNFERHKMKEYNVRRETDDRSKSRERKREQYKKHENGSNTIETFEKSCKTMEDPKNMEGAKNILNKNINLEVATDKNVKAIDTFDGATKIVNVNQSCKTVAIYDPKLNSAPINIPNEVTADKPVHDADINKDKENANEKTFKQQDHGEESNREINEDSKLSNPKSEHIQSGIDYTYERENEAAQEFVLESDDSSECAEILTEVKIFTLQKSPEKNEQETPQTEPPKNQVSDPILSPNLKIHKSAKTSEKKQSKVNVRKTKIEEVTKKLFEKHEGVAAGPNAKRCATFKKVNKTVEHLEARLSYINSHLCHDLLDQKKPKSSKSRKGMKQIKIVQPAPATTDSGFLVAEMNRDKEVTSKKVAEKIEETPISNVIKDIITQEKKNIHMEISMEEKKEENRLSLKQQIAMDLFKEKCDENIGKEKSDTSKGQIKANPKKANAETKKLVEGPRSKSSKAESTHLKKKGKSKTPEAKGEGDVDKKPTEAKSDKLDNVAVEKGSVQTKQVEGKRIRRKSLEEPLTPNPKNEISKKLRRRSVGSKEDNHDKKQDSNSKRIKSDLNQLSTAGSKNDNSEAQKLKKSEKSETTKKLHTKSVQPIEDDNMNKGQELKTVESKVQECKATSKNSDEELESLEAEAKELRRKIIEANEFEDKEGNEESKTVATKLVQAKSVNIDVEQLKPSQNTETVETNVDEPGGKTIAANENVEQKERSENADSNVQDVKAKINSNVEAIQPIENSKSHDTKTNTQLNDGKELKKSEPAESKSQPGPIKRRKGVGVRKIIPNLPQNEDPIKINKEINTEAKTKTEQIANRRKSMNTKKINTEVSSRVLRSGKRKNCGKETETNDSTTTESEETSTEDLTKTDTAKCKSATIQKIPKSPPTKISSAPTENKLSFPATPIKQMEINLTHDGEIPVLHISEESPTKNVFDLSKCIEMCSKDSPFKKYIVENNNKNWEKDPTITSTPKCDKSSNSLLRDDLNTSSFEQSKDKTSGCFTSPEKRSTPIINVVNNRMQFTCNTTRRRKRMIILTEIV